MIIIIGGQSSSLTAAPMNKASRPSARVMPKKDQTVQNNILPGIRTRERDRTIFCKSARVAAGLKTAEKAARKSDKN